MHEVVPATLSQAARRRRSVSGSDPDRRRQGPTDRRVRRTRGARAWEAWLRPASPRKKNCSSPAIGPTPSRWPIDSPALLLIRRIRDEAHRFAVTFHRQSRQKRDLRSELDCDRRASARGAARRCSSRSAALPASVAPPAKSSSRVVGVKCADAVLAHFAAHATQINP